MGLHIHRWKTRDINFEQPVGTANCYMDIKILKCRCGKEKKEMINIYRADSARISLYSNPDITYNGLVNKVSLI